MVTFEQLDLGPVLDADQWWRDGAERAVRALAKTGRTFQISEIREDPWSIPEPRHPNVYGALARAMAAAGVIECVGYAQSTSPTRHGSVVRLWRGAPDVNEGA